MVDNVPPTQAFEAIKTDAAAHLVDVRTSAEWTFIGLPDFSGANKQPLTISWQVYPTMQVNQAFIDDMRKAGLTPDHHIYFLCRSGGRSMAAALAAQAAGFPHVYNVADGFEGNPDHKGHRGTVAGWKASELPWRQS